MNLFWKVLLSGDATYFAFNLIDRVWPPHDQMFNAFSGLLVAIAVAANSIMASLAKKTGGQG